jgi:hypothetical protein
MGLVFARAGQPATALNFNGQSLNYHWLDDANSYNWNPGLIPPLNQWSFAALVVEPTQATIYLINTNGMTNAVNVLAHANRRSRTTSALAVIRTILRRAPSTVLSMRCDLQLRAVSSQVRTSTLAPALKRHPERPTVGGNIVLSWPQGRC